MVRVLLQILNEDNVKVDRAISIDADFVDVTLGGSLGSGDEISLRGLITEVRNRE